MRMGQVEQCTGGILSDVPIGRLSQRNQQIKSTRASNDALVRFMGGEVGDATDGIALNLEAVRAHEIDEWLKAIGLDDR